MTTTNEDKLIVFDVKTTNCTPETKRVIVSGLAAAATGDEHGVRDAMKLLRKLSLADQRRVLTLFGAFDSFTLKNIGKPYSISIDGAKPVVGTIFVNV
jgi:hypothetical protein